MLTNAPVTTTPIHSRTCTAQCKGVAYVSAPLCAAVFLADPTGTNIQMPAAQFQKTLILKHGTTLQDLPWKLSELGAIESLERLEREGWCSMELTL
jgi:hypothetical protein